MQAKGKPPPSIAAARSSRGSGPRTARQFARLTESSSAPQARRSSTMTRSARSSRTTALAPL